MTFRDLTGHLSFLGLRLQHRALVEEAKYLKAEAIRGEKRKPTKNKANGEETKPHRSAERMIPAIPACTIACCRLKASMSPGFAIAPAIAPWREKKQKKKTHKGFFFLNSEADETMF